jgi:cytochrome c biogenesis protein CcmG/thiol:disulfide interchange protein DsbE
MTFHRSSLGVLFLSSFVFLGCAGSSAQVSDETGSGPNGLKVETAAVEMAQANASSFEATDLDGEDFDLSDHLGKDVIILSFWSTWCGPCKAEMPTLQKLHETHDGKGLKIVSISLDGADTMAGVKPYIKSNGYTFTVVIDEDTAIAQSYNPRSALPFMVMLNRQGAIHKQVEGFQLSEADHLVSEVNALVEAK